MYSQDKKKNMTDKTNIFFLLYTKHKRSETWVGPSGDGETWKEAQKTQMI